MRTIRYIEKTSIAKICSSKVGTFLLLFLFYMWGACRPYVDFSREMDYPISWCIFPFCMSSFSILSIYYIGMIYVNSDVPFMQHINMYQVIRAGRRRWAVGQLVGIGIRSFFLVAVSAAAVVLPFWGRLEFSSDWGKLIYTLASIRKSNGFYSERLVEFRFHYEILLEYTPLGLMGLTILLCTLILTLLGLLMFFLSLYWGKACAVAGGLVFVLLLFVAENTPGAVRQKAAHVIPAYWAEIALAETPVSGHFRLPSLSYMLLFLAASIGILSFLICRKVRHVEFYWENEDA